MQINKVNIELKYGDIVKQPDISAIVNAANAELRIGGGVAGAIHQVAGYELTKACHPLAPIKPGDAVITQAYNLPNKYVIHCLGPVYGKDKPEAELLAECYKNAIQLAEKHNINSIAFPAISTGAFGYPIQKATEIVVKTISECCHHIKNLKTIRFVLFSKNDLEIYQKKFIAFTNTINEK